MFQESEWDCPDLDSSLREALLSKPQATPTRVAKSRNKYRPNAVKKPKVEPAPLAAEVPGLGKRKRTKASKEKAVKTKTPKEKGAPKVKGAKHVKCSVFDSIGNWDEVIDMDELENEGGETLAQYVSGAVLEINKENNTTETEQVKPIKKRKKKDPTAVNTELNAKVKRKSSLKKVHFEGEPLNESVGGTALSELSLESEETESVVESVQSTTSSLQSAKEKINKLKGKFQKKLDASQFRYINEKLYTCSGEEAVEMFEQKPELFDVYHRGFSNQVAKWETNPVDTIIQYIQLRGESEVVADFGCGDAKIAATVSNAVFSFDLVKANEHVIVANSSKVPLAAKSVDIAVFCLSLMGTNFKDYIREARRVLRTKGRLVIAEVTSRIADNAVFVSAVEELGFKSVHMDTSNTHFVQFVFKRTKPQENKGKFESLTLKHCSYKKR